MKKLFIGMIIITALLMFILGVTPQVARMQAEVVCEQDVIVQTDESLSTIASRLYGDVLAFPAIVEATNAKAATDNSYTRIDNANLVEPGSKLCAPSQTDAQAILSRIGPAGISVMTAGPEVDRIGFPEGYQEWTIFYEFDRPQNQTARVIYANEAATLVKPGQPFFPYGSVLVMESYRTQKDENGNILLNENGHYVRDELTGIFVMRKEPGFGAKYGDRMNGEWEYIAYRPDGTTLVAPENTLACAACHIEASQGNDWVFGIHRFFGETMPEPAENEVRAVDYTFQPETLTVKVGTEVRWISQDVIFHSVTAVDGSFSGALRPSQGFSYTFEQPGVFEYFSAFYPSMKGKIEVVE
jgi:plastocyanin